MRRIGRWRAWASKRWRFRPGGGDETVPGIRGWSAGRAHLIRDMDETGPPGPEFSTEWTLGDPWRFALEISLGPTIFADGDPRNVTIQFAIPFVQVFLSGNRVLPSWLLPGDRIIPGSGRRPPWAKGKTIYDRTTGREIGFSCHDGSIWISVWRRGDGSWRKKDPWWWGIQSFDPVALLIGESETRRVGEDDLGEVEIPMPEGVYKGKATRTRYVTKRRWWPAKHWSRITLEDFVSPLKEDGDREPFAEGKAIPYPGKGENSWDCGMDGCFSQSAPAGIELPEAIGQLTASVLRTRLKRTGSMFWKPELETTDGR